MGICNEPSMLGIVQHALYSNVFCPPQPRPGNCRFHDAAQLESRLRERLHGAHLGAPSLLHHSGHNALRQACLKLKLTYEPADYSNLKHSHQGPGA